MPARTITPEDQAAARQEAQDAALMSFGGTPSYRKSTSRSHPIQSTNPTTHRYAARKGD